MTASEPAIPEFRYTATMAARIEAAWQDRWAREGTFEAPNPIGDLAPVDGVLPAEKTYLLDMFPYPSGAGLHVGHPLGYIGTDCLGRFLRMNGRNVLHTIGFDAFGLPAEQYAIRTGTHPAVTTEQNIERYRAQLRRLGFGHDQRRSVATTDPGYVRWTQWIFTRLFESWYDVEQQRARPVEELVAELADGSRTLPDGRSWAELDQRERAAVLEQHRLAYVAEGPVNWCPGLGTVLAGEEVTSEGRSAIGNFPVFRRSMRQWMLRITAYADRLIDDLERLDWPDPIKIMQRNWIGRSTGARVRFSVVDSAELIGVYTTRPDTLFGATYLVLAPEHPLVDDLVARQWPPEVDRRWTGGADTPIEAVTSYRRSAAAKTDLERQENREKTGVFLGCSAINPASGSPVPVFVADYVLPGYGTGAIMGVPAQDTRDLEFAETFGLPVVRTVAAPDDHPVGQAWTGDGLVINSTSPEVSLDGLDVTTAKTVITSWLEERGHGRAETQYKLRDWLFARQRYWGEPFPIVWDTDGVAHSLPDDLLPLQLPEMADYSPTRLDPEDAGSQPQPPLSRAAGWTRVRLDLGDGEQTYTRELNVMPQWAGSCWYELRYVDPTNTESFCDPVNEAYWLGKDPTRPDDPGGVDLYVGGVEHGVLHLLYARFWHKVLFDLGHVSSEEPFRRLFNQGYIQAHAFTDHRGLYVPAADVVEDAPDSFSYQGLPVRREYGKMGKSLNNVVTPDEMCERFGADVFRVYEMSMGPLDASRPWQTRDAIGAQRFLQRLWRLVVDEQTGETVVLDETPDQTTERLLHTTIDGVRRDFGQLSYHTAIAKLITLTNHVVRTGGRVARPVAEGLVLMTAPLAPHVCEELWQRLGHRDSLAHGPYPTADPALLTTELVSYPVQVRGKVKATIDVPAGTSPQDVETAVLSDERVVSLLGGVAPRKVVVVPGRMISIVL
jgi:leucyl-tRNA synthetase